MEDNKRVVLLVRTLTCHAFAQTGAAVLVGLGVVVLVLVVGAVDVFVVVGVVDVFVVVGVEVDVEVLVDVDVEVEVLVDGAVVGSSVNSPGPTPLLVQ